MPGFRPRFFSDDPGPGSSSGESGTAGAELTLNAEDSHHVSRVLRLQRGDECEVVVGGSTFAAAVSSAKDPVRVVLSERLQGAEAGASYHMRVGLVQALTRPALLEQVLEKGTEVGTSFFMLVPAAGSTSLPGPARAARLQRWQRIVLEAAKQSKQTTVPSVEVLPSLKAAADRLEAEGASSVVLEPSASAMLGEVLEREVASSQASSGERREAALALWIGPESGWSQQELQEFSDAHITAARLGQSVLRAETAGPVAVAAARLLAGDW